MSRIDATVALLQRKFREKHSKDFGKNDDDNDYDDEGTVVPESDQRVGEKEEEEEEPRDNSRLYTLIFLALFTAVTMLQRVFLKCFGMCRNGNEPGGAENVHVQGGDGGGNSGLTNIAVEGGREQTLKGAVGGGNVNTNAAPQGPTGPTGPPGPPGPPP